MNIAVQLPTQEQEFNAIVLENGNIRLDTGEELSFERDKTLADVFYATINGQEVPIVTSAGENNTIVLSLLGYRYVVSALTEREQVFRRMLRQTAIGGAKPVRLTTPMPGLIKAVVVKEGATVKKGDRLFILEAMKMENDIKSPADGVVSKIAVAAGQAVEKSVFLCLIEPPKATE